MASNDVSSQLEKGESIPSCDQDFLSERPCSDVEGTLVGSVKADVHGIQFLQLFHNMVVRLIALVKSSIIAVLRLIRSLCPFWKGHGKSGQRRMGDPRVRKRKSHRRRR